MSEQHDLENMPMALTNKIRRWNYDESIVKMRPLVREWGKATKEVFRELYLAREFLTTQKGQYKDPLAKNFLPHSWKSYCEELGLSYQTVNNWLRPFTPKELSPTGKDTLMLAPPMKTETTADRALMLARVAEFLRTGERPADWGEEEEAEAKRQLKNTELAMLVEKYNAPAISKAKDYFSDVMGHSKSIVNFKLKDDAQKQAQFHVFRHIEAYLATFEDPETKSKAAFNLALKARNIANEIAELYFNPDSAENTR